MKLIIAIIVAISVLLLLKVFRIGLKRLANLYPDWNFRISYIAVFELVLWLVYIFWAMDYLFREKFYYRYLVIALLFIVCGFIAWYLIRDIIAGIIFKAKHDLKTGSHIRSGIYAGTVKSQHLTYMEVRTDDGQLIRVPYSRINQEVISEVAHTESMEEQRIHVQIDSSLSKTDAGSLIRTTILNSPWSNLKEEPSIKLLEENEHGYVFEIMLFSMNLKHMNFIEMALEKTPSAQVVQLDSSIAKNR